MVPLFTQPRSLDLLFNFHCPATSDCTPSCTMGLPIWYKLGVMVSMLENCMAGQLTVLTPVQQCHWELLQNEGAL